MRVYAYEYTHMHTHTRAREGSNERKTKIFAHACLHFLLHQLLDKNPSQPFCQSRSCLRALSGAPPLIQSSHLPRHQLESTTCQGKLRKKRAAGRRLRLRVLTWCVWEAALNLATSLSRQLNCCGGTNTGPQQQNLTSLLVEVEQALPPPAAE